MDLKRDWKVYQGLLILPCKFLMLFFERVKLKKSFFCAFQFETCSTSLLLGYNCEVVM